MKHKKLLAILLAVALVLNMTVSVSAAKRLDINGKIVIGTLVWSGNPYVSETLTVTTKMREIDEPAYGLRARFYGEYRYNTGKKDSIPWYDPIDTGAQFNLKTLEVSKSFTIENGVWLEATAFYNAYYRDLETDEHEVIHWNV